MNIDEIKKELEKDLTLAKNIEDLNNLKNKYLSKNGIITVLYSNMKKIPKEEKKTFNLKINHLKDYFNSNYEEMKEKFEKELLADKLEHEIIDISLPSKKIKRGSKHPITRVVEQLEDSLLSLGYTVFDLDELNLNKEDEKIKSLVEDNISINKKSLQVIYPLETYKYNEEKNKFSQNMQLEGLVIGKNISLADLKGTLELTLKKVLGIKTKIRFRFNYSSLGQIALDVDVNCFNCATKGCSLCNNGFIKVADAFMLYPSFLENFNLDNKIYQGFRFNFLIDNLAIFKYEIKEDLRLYENDVRFLKQFDRKDDENEVK